jgi:hypothetical protein
MEQRKYGSLWSICRSVCRRSRGCGSTRSVGLDRDELNFCCLAGRSAVVRRFLGILYNRLNPMYHLPIRTRLGTTMTITASSSALSRSVQDEALVAHALFNIEGWVAIGELPGGIELTFSDRRRDRSGIGHRKCPGSQRSKSLHHGSARGTSQRSGEEIRKW